VKPNTNRYAAFASLALGIILLPCILVQPEQAQQLLSIHVRFTFTEKRSWTFSLPSGNSSPWRFRTRSHRHWAYLQGVAVAEALDL
jgi:hypothetical protein